MISNFDYIDCNGLYKEIYLQLLERVSEQQRKPKPRQHQSLEMKKAQHPVGLFSYGVVQGITPVVPIFHVLELIIIVFCSGTSCS